MNAVELKSVLDRLQAAERSLRKLANTDNSSGSSNGGLGGAIESMAEPKDFTGMETATNAPLGVMGPQRTPGGNVSLPAAGGMPTAPNVQAQQKPQQQPVQPAAAPLGQKPLATSTDPTVTLPSQRPMPNRTPAGMTALSKSAFELPEVSPTMLNAGAGGLLGAGLGAAAGGLHHYMQDEEDRDPAGVTSSLISGGLMGGLGGAALGGYTSPFFSGEATPEAPKPPADTVRAPGPRPKRTPPRELKVPENVKRWKDSPPRPPDSKAKSKLTAQRGDLFAQSLLPLAGLPIPGMSNLIGGAVTPAVGAANRHSIRDQFDRSLRAGPVTYGPAQGAAPLARKKTSAVKEAVWPLLGTAALGLGAGALMPSLYRWWNSSPAPQQPAAQQRQAQQAARYPAPPQPTPQALQQAQARATQFGKENPLPMQNHWLWGQQVDWEKAREQSVARNTQHRAEAAQAGAFRTKALDADVAYAKARQAARATPSLAVPDYNYAPSGAKPGAQGPAAAPKSVPQQGPVRSWKMAPSEQPAWVPQPAFPTTFQPKPQQAATQPAPMAPPKPAQQPTAPKVAAFNSKDTALYGLGGAGIGAALGGLDYAFDDRKDEEDSPSLALRMLAGGGMGGLGGALIGSHIDDRVTPGIEQAERLQKETKHWVDRAKEQQRLLGQAELDRQNLTKDRDGYRNLYDIVSKRETATNAEANKLRKQLEEVQAQYRKSRWW